MLKKLRAKFVIVNMSIVLGMLLIIFGMLLNFTRIDLEKDTNAVLHTLAQNATKPGTPKAVDTNLRYFSIHYNALMGDVYISGDTYLPITDEAFLEQIVRTVYELRDDEGYIEEYDLRYYRIFSREVMAVGFVDVSSYNEVMNSLLVSAVIIGAVSIFVFFVISLLLARWMVKPVDTAWNKQKQFISDASHELKTPLTVIMSNAELLQSADEDGAREQYSSNIMTMSHRMRDLVEGLLDLSRVDNGTVKQSFVRLDLSKLTEDGVLPFEPLFFEKGLVFQSNIEPGITVNGSEQYLTQILQILLDNALKYSEPGIVELQLFKKARNQALLTVSNPGTPIPQQEQAHIFDRFYRSDKARTGSGSFGLGLAIAKSSVEEHGGKIWVDSNSTGNCFFVQLPCE